MAVFGSTYVAGTVPLVLLSALLVPLTYLVAWELWGLRWQATLAGDPGPLRRTAADHVPDASTTSPCSASPAPDPCTAPCARSAPTAPARGWSPAGRLPALATLARIDGVLLTAAVATAWFVRRGWTPWKPDRRRWRDLGLGLRFGRRVRPGPGPVAGTQRREFGTPLPSAGGHTLWITSYNEQFSIGHEVSLATYLDWGVVNIVGSKLVAWAELVGRTAVLLGGTFLIFFVGRAVDLPDAGRPRAVPRLLRPDVLRDGCASSRSTHRRARSTTRHRPGCRGPSRISVAAIAPACSAPAACGRSCDGRRRTGSSRSPAWRGRSCSRSSAPFRSSSGTGIALGFATSRRRRSCAPTPEPTDVIMASDPASIYPLSGNPGVAAPFDPFRVIEQVVDAYRRPLGRRPQPGDRRTRSAAPVGRLRREDSEGANPRSCRPSPPSRATT